jgi:hypothetical protein
MITLQELNEDPRYRKMTLRSLAYTIDRELPFDDFNNLEGTGAVNKADILLSQWAAEGNQGRAREWTEEDEIAELRKLLWFRHGCPISALYGDDGEMQCGRCGIDFKRDSAESIERKLTNAFLGISEAKP